MKRRAELTREVERLRDLRVQVDEDQLVDRLRFLGEQFGVTTHEIPTPSVLSQHVLAVRTDSLGHCQTTVTPRADEREVEQRCRALEDVELVAQYLLDLIDRPRVGERGERHEER